MDKSDNVETETPEKSDRLIHYFVAAVGLIYGCGFLIVFTFLKSFGIDSADFVEAKYIHVGFLFFLACLVVAMPFWWTVWPMRSKFPNEYSRRIFGGMLRRTWKERAKYFRDDPLKSFYSPEAFSLDKTHGIHASPAVRISMILILWSFGSIVMFAPSEFGHNHAKLLIFSFLTPMTVLILGFWADLFKIGKFSVSQNLYLQGVRHDLRVWWSVVGAIYCLCFLTINYFRHELLPLWIYFGIPVVAIFKTFWKLFNSNRGRKIEDAKTRIATCQWTLYTLQWATVILQMWVFIWTIKPHTLGVSHRQQNLWVNSSGSGRRPNV